MLLTCLCEDSSIVARQYYYYNEIKGMLECSSKHFVCSGQGPMVLTIHVHIVGCTALLLLFVPSSNA